MQAEARFVAAAILVAGAVVAAFIAITGRYTIGKLYTGSEAQTVYGIDTWTGEPFVKSSPYDQ
jgi:hypothetical protein